MSDKNEARYHHGDLSAAALKASPELILEIGLDKFTLRELARRIGVSHTAMYRHYSSKRDLLVALAIEGHERFSVALKPTSEPDLSTALYALAYRYLSWASSHQGFYQVMFGPRLNTDGKHPKLEQVIGQSLKVVSSIFAIHGFSENRSYELCISVMTLLHGYTDLVSLQRIRVSDQRESEKFLHKIISPFVNGVSLEVNKRSAE